MKYKSGEHHVIIDVIKTCIQIYASLNSIKFSTACTIAAEKADVNRRTLYNWFGGKTTCPRFDTAEAVVKATGEEIKIGPHGVTRPHKYRVVPGKKKVA